MRKYVTAFGVLFSHMQVVRFNDDGSENNRVVVPIKYGPKEKWAVKTIEDPDLVRTKAIVLPRMAFEMIGFKYDSSRKQPTTTYTSFTPFQGDATQYKSASLMYSPVPYNIEFNLYILTKSVDEASQIVEQILPMFAPDFTLTMNTVPEMQQVATIPILLEAVEGLDNWDGAFTERREIIWTLRFQMKAYFYGPIRNGKPIITSATINFVNGSGAVVDSITTSAAPDQEQNSSDAVRWIGFDPVREHNDPTDPFGFID